MQGERGPMGIKGDDGKIGTQGPIGIRGSFRFRYYIIDTINYIVTDIYQFNLLTIVY